MTKTKKIKEYYSLRADVKLETKDTLKKVRSMLELQGKPNGIPEAIDLVFDYYKTNNNSKLTM